MSGQTVLVTGGSGFIGSYVARRLLEVGHAPIVFDQTELRPEGRFLLGDRVDEVVVEQGSIEDWGRLLGVVRDHRPTAVIHLATITNPVYLRTNPGPGIRVNFEGTINVLEAMRLFDVPRLVYVSSIGVLAKPQYEPIDASHPVFLARSGPSAGVYGATKVAGEAFCFAYNDAFGVDFRIVRASAVYGFGMQWPIFVKPMVEGAVRGEPVSFATGGPLPRDYTHAADVASLLVELIGAPSDADRIFYGATGEPLVTASELARIVEQVVPGSSVRIGDAMSDQDLFELASRGQLSVENARQQLGWEQQFRHLRDGVVDYVERYRAYLDAAGA